MAKDKDEQKSLAKFLIHEFNKGSDEPIAWNLEDPNPTDVKEFISTGSTVLDYLIANRRDGGVPVGKITEIVGEEATGKSLMAAHIIANTQKKGGIAIYIDTENAANSDFMKRIGVDIAKLVYLQPGTIEECFEAVEKTITMARAKDTKCPVTVIWDSIAGTPPKAEIEGDYDPNSRIGLMAKALAKGMRKITGMVGREKVTLVFTNQLKVKIGVMYGDPMTTPGGKAIPYHASVRVRLTRSKEIKEEKTKEVYGVRTLAKVFKSRLGPPMRKCEFNVMYRDGIDDPCSIHDTLHARGIITKAGGWDKIIGPDGHECKFRSDDWAELVKGPGWADHIQNVLELALVVKFDDTDIPDAGIDTESVLEMETLAEEMGTDEI